MASKSQSKQALDDAAQVCKGFRMVVDGIGSSCHYTILYL